MSLPLRHLASGRSVRHFLFRQNVLCILNYRVPADLRSVLGIRDLLPVRAVSLDGVLAVKEEESHCG